MCRIQDQCAKTILNDHAALAARLGIELPKPTDNPGDVDTTVVNFWTTVVERDNLSLPDAVRLFRGETPADPRPNKHLFELPLPADPAARIATARWNAIVQHGLQPQWTEGVKPSQPSRPRNHQSINSHIARIRHHLRKGQEADRYLIVTAHILERWPDVFISPLGVVEKAGGVDIRLINDYSFPPLCVGKRLH